MSRLFTVSRFTASCAPSCLIARLDMLPTPQPRDVILCNRVGIEEREELPHDIALPNIPPCLPDLPPVHTFAYTPVYPNMSVDSKTRVWVSHERD